ncbi:MAG: DUF6288 domain-containing protein [Akkermansiaceae bacterium]|nr:DUF6288 domain-containing protein [Akkermansiaceae bacterium]
MNAFLPLSLLLLIPLSHAQERELAKLPSHLTPVPYMGVRNWHLTQNLGATGARGWIAGEKGDSHDSREILIKSIEPGSPADGILQPYDLIIGAAVPPDTPASSWTSAPPLKPFETDARLAIARAITWAESEAGKGELKLLRVRNGEEERVTIELPVMGTYSDTAPFNCPKSAKIVADAAVFLAKHMPGDGYTPGVGDPHHAGLLLATHDPQYLDHVRRSAVRMSELHTITDAGHETWRWGNTNTFLCEYYLATGDERVLPTIEGYAKVLTDGQCNPGTWGHRGVPNWTPPGYGSVNSTGLVCFYSLILGKQAGVTYSDKAIANSAGFYGKYAGRGNIPYGDHTPYYDTSNGGKAGKAALCFYMLDAHPAAQWFARLSASSNLKSFEGGHSGNYFNQTWTPLGVQLAGPENTIAFWKRFLSYRDLCRRRDGSFIAQPWPHKREGDLGTGNYVSKGPMWNTGGFALSYLAGTERLAMLGRRDSCFAVDAPKELAPALSQFRAKDFAAAAATAAQLKSSADARVAKLAAQLEGVAQRNLESIPLTLASMEESLEKGDLFTLKHQLLAIESVIDPADERLTRYREAMDHPEIETILKNGDMYHRGIKGMAMEGEKGFITCVPVVEGRGRSLLEHLARKPEEPYGKLAAEALAESEPYSGRAGKPLVAFKAGGEHGPKKTHTIQVEIELENAEKLRELYFSYKMAKLIKLRVNGTLVLDLKLSGRPDSRDVTLLLKPVTSELLQDGKNLITLDFEPADKTFEASLSLPR